MRQHTGFFLSMGLGGVFGPIHMNSNVEGEYDMSGTGGLFDFKIGGAVKENLILHATILSNSLIGPKITAAGGSVKTSDQLSIGEAMFGGGLTYYFMPSNLFISGSVGAGNFSIVNQENDYKASTERGLSFQLKAGKEWWVSRRWGLGAAITYGKTSVNSKPSNDLQEILSSNRFGILFSATLN
ncbi:hypothetical protein G5B30_09030 [Sphingobacterium sp. SGG-5]|uniref:hypothetical protein n=1 Tax=Sphingobacterium sp. SGG-5 TaxID=2710881 RepID=UPI0013EC9852|nr:hypothetical protein [Sphingobacterium sp. SGG-5]NGM62056.1 hypothetical protein [Sphingobacterium sp. SGG-5]